MSARTFRRAAALLCAGMLGGGSAHAEDAARARARELATCAAYYYNATNVRPLGEYEALYGAGERAFNRALAILERAAVDELVARAATDMTALTGGDWKNYHRVVARYGDACDALVGFGR